MRHLTFWLLSIGLAATVFYHIQNPQRADAVLGNFSFPSGCRLPVTLHLGDYDSRFPFSEEAFRQALEEAINLWEQGTDTPLFRLTESAGMPVNLVFDERQRAANERAQQESQLDHSSEEIAQRRDALEQQQQALNRQWSDFQQQQQQLNQAVEQRNKQVERWNTGQLAQTARNRARLEAEQERIESERDRLQRRRQELEQQTAQIEAEFRSLNADIDRFNHRSQSYRAQGPSLVQAGQFRQLGNFRVIDIFHATDTDRLRLVLAHELGHALGLDHVSSPAAVMHDTTTEANAHRRTLSEADRKALEAACGV